MRWTQARNEANRRPHLELRLLRYFVAVAEELHFARDGRASLALEQSPVSRAMRNLEARSACSCSTAARTRRD